MEITDTDMREQVTRAIEEDSPGNYDIPAIVDEIRREHGTVHIDDVPDARFWEIVEKHAVV